MTVVAAVEGMEMIVMFGYMLMQHRPSHQPNSGNKTALPKKVETVAPFYFRLLQHSMHDTFEMQTENARPFTDNDDAIQALALVRTQIDRLMVKVDQLERQIVTDYK
jgi:hypothetical protein